MIITKELLAGKILAFLNRRISVDEFANWAETAMIDSEYQEEYAEEISDALAKIGLINVENFKLSIAFYLNTLIKLDYQAIFGLEPKTETQDQLTYV